MNFLPLKEFIIKRGHICVLHNSAIQYIYLLSGERHVEMMESRMEAQTRTVMLPLLVDAAWMVMVVVVCDGFLWVMVMVPVGVCPG